jgi:hypothetical protein
MREDREIWVREANFVREVWICEECGEVESFEREIAGY